MDIHAVAASGLAIPSPSDLSSSGERIKKSLAVLPFVNMSSDPENEYFTDGITEEILNALVKFDDLKVTARTSSFVFKDKQEDVREIGRTLNVGAVLEGSVRKAGNRVRITAQLVDTADGYHLFSKSYDRVLEDIFAVQDEIAHTIARELRVLFPVAGAQTPTTVPKLTESFEAYSLYLRGLHCWNQFTPNTTQEALRHFREVLALDPDFALAHTGVARCYVHLGAQSRLLSEEAYPVAQAAAQRAIELDPEIAMGHVSLGLVRLFYDWDLAAARSCLERAIELNPGSAEARHWAGYYYMASGHFDEFLETAQVAASLDPLSLLALDLLGTAHIFAGRPREGLIHYDRALEIDPTFRTAIEGRAQAYDRLGEHDRAIEEFLRYRALTPGGVGAWAPERTCSRGRDGRRRLWATSPSSRTWSGPARNSPSTSTSWSPSLHSVVSTRRSSGWNEPSRPASATWSSSDTPSTGRTWASIPVWTRSWPPWGCSETGSRFPRPVDCPVGCPVD